ncbi:hypothetical protein [Rhizobium bangladeshense]|uniref:hypothetical protein n=1 Tax=Rhizobium bangladeshense TaxID=1138189 RepID=UPI001C83ECFF|nr:hypothetical protein [Rhizobium bangladeshense]MBX4898759.1 hypothetical protein [Rhizobium bangladeshense]MBY3616783.1 hypothetical protein [Rhizobium bangladeshense]
MDDERWERAAGTIAAAMEKAVEQGRRRRAKVERERAKARASATDYEPGIVTFIDVLGFRAMLSNRPAGEIHEIVLSLREFTTPEVEHFSRMKEVRLSSRAFAESVSDAVVRVRVFNTQHSDGAFFQELLDLLHIQIQCIDHGVFIRAGVAIGDVHVGVNGAGPVFGPAMVRAYDIESGEAIYPRIVVDDAAYEQFLSDVRLHNEDHDLDEEADYVNGLLRVGEDGTRFIDYLAASESEFDTFEGYIAFVGRHADPIRQNLSQVHKPRIRRKYVWLARYHNEVISNIRIRFESGELSATDLRTAFGKEATELLAELVVKH